MAPSSKAGLRTAVPGGPASLDDANDNGYRYHTKEVIKVKTGFLLLT